MQKTCWYSRTSCRKFGDLITADHKVLTEGRDSRNNHRYAVVVQDLAPQWIQSYPCKTTISQETQRTLQKFLEPNRKPKVIYTDNSLEFGKACEDLSWNHCTSTPHRSETNGIAERAVRREKEGTSAVLLQSSLDNEWWADSMECYCFLRNIQDLLSDGKTPYVWTQHHHTSYFLVFHSTHSMSHVTLAQAQGVLRARHPCVIRMLLLSWYSSTLYSAFFTVSLIFFFILLIFIFIFIFHVGWFDEKSHAYFCEWGVRHFGREQASHNIKGGSECHLPDQ